MKYSKGLFQSAYIEKSYEMSQYHGLQNSNGFFLLEPQQTFSGWGTVRDFFPFLKNFTTEMDTMPPSESIGSSTANLKNWKFQRLTAFQKGKYKHRNIVCVHNIYIYLHHIRIQHLNWGLLLHGFFYSSLGVDFMYLCGGLCHINACFSPMEAMVVRTISTTTYARVYVTHVLGWP